ncbi:DUF3793 family protein [Alkaliphilus transvaalensis]|uniref:DUF3793 family protein n=1 Tax=Alkaliphilus transvaalensis TaxID=114628 RepID=UPI00055188F7|nr:DUF3793 family protein [Alkaliphilus transvaalensis]
MNNCFCLSKHNNLLSWYTELLGPVLLGAKPAEILSFPQRKDNDMIVTQKVKELFGGSKQIYFKEMSYCGKCIKLFFYNPVILDRTLREKRNLKFLQLMGYPKEYSFDSYLAHLINKINLGIIPDEIGIFLGYPLKDVLGFIGHPSLKLTKVDAWRVYGDTRLSDQTRNSFREAREEMKRMLQVKSPESIVLSA